MAWVAKPLIASRRTLRVTSLHIGMSVGQSAIRQHQSAFLQAATPQDGSRKSTFAVLLNWELPSAVPRLLQNAQTCVCADGGANRLHDQLPVWHPDEAPDRLRRRFRPMAVVGDLDSIRPDVRLLYEGMGVQVIDQSEDQDSTDLQKCLAWVRAQAAEAGLTPADCTVIAAGALGGRLDHTLSALSTLHRNSDLDIVLWGDGSLARLLSPGEHHIHACPELEGDTCGLVPLAGPATASSHGLKWDLDRTRMDMTGLISTSNQRISDTVTVTTDAPLLWVTEVQEAA